MAGPRRSPSNNNNNNMDYNESWWEDDPFNEDTNMEVTHDEFQRLQASQRKQKPPTGRRLLLRSLRNPRNKGSSNSNSPPTTKTKQGNTDTTADGQVSVGGAFTVASNDDTVQVSNRRNNKAETNKKLTVATKPWKTLKRLVTSKMGVSERTLHTSTSTAAVDSSTHSTRERARSEAGANVLRVDTSGTEDNARKRSDTDPSNRGLLKRFDTEPVVKGLLGKSRNKKVGEDAVLDLKREQSQLDDAIRGRLDGMDVLSLGSARVTSIPSSPREEELLQPMTQSLKHSTHQIITEMLWTSGGKDQAEMVLEGFIPAGDDRWMVLMETGPPSDKKSPRSSPKAMQKQKTTPQPSPDSSESASSTFSASSCGSALCGSVDASTASPPTTLKSFANPFEVPLEEEELQAEEDDTPMHVLLKSMWGSNPPPPTHMSRAGTDTTRSDTDESTDEDDVLQLAASCSVPIDIDEDTFIIDTAAHLRSVHDILSEPLKHGRYEDALQIFRKIIKGLEQHSGGGHQQKRPLHLIGSTHHNMGVVQMWQGKYHDALDSFEQAVAFRERYLPKNHVDIAESLAREGMALFCLESFDLAVQSFERALHICKTPNATRAKLLNNLGVAHYQKQDLMEALVAFTAALEIQRKWLDGPVRRASIVFDASVTLSNMGKVYLERKDYDTALYVYEEALLLQTASFRKDHDIVVMSLGNLAYAKAMHGDITKALQIYKGVLRSQELKYGAQSREAVETIGLMGLLHAQNEDHKDALRCLSTVYKWQQQHLNPYNPAVKNVKATMKRIERLKQNEGSAWI